MTVLELLTIIGGIMLAIIGFFLRKTMEDLKEVKILGFDTKNQLDILKNDHQNKHANITEKFDELKTSVQDLTKEIKELNKKLK